MVWPPDQGYGALIVDKAWATTTFIPVGTNFDLDSVSNFDLHFCPAVFETDDHRRTSNIKGSRCLWMDIDEVMEWECVLHQLPVLPSVIVQSSPGKHHVYWQLDTVITDVDQIQRANYALASNTRGADMSGWDATQLLRLPAGVNSKPEANGHRPCIVYLDPDAVYKIERFLTLPHDDTGPWQRISVRPEVVEWNGELPDLDDSGLTGKSLDWLINGCSDRSNGRYCVVSSLADIGKDENYMVGLLYQSPLGEHMAVEALERDISRIMAKREDQPQAKPPVIRQQVPSDSRPVEARTSWAGEPLADILSGAFEPLTPTMLRCTTGVCLLYPGRSHSIAGESGGGKSLCAQAAVAQVLLSGGTALYIDYESDVVSVVRERLADTFQVPHELLLGKFVYIGPDGKPSSAELQPLLDREFNLVVVDGVTTSLSHWGLSGRSEDEVTLWNSEFVVPLERSGAAVLLIDHVTKSADGRGNYAIGSQAKRSNLTGASYLARNVQPFGRGLRGVLELKLGGKDRPGQVQRHADSHKVIARFVLDSTNPDSPTFEFVSTSTVNTEAEGFTVPDDSWTRYAIEYISSHPGCSKRDVIKSMGSGGKVAKERAVDDLVTTGQVNVEKAESKGLADRYSLRDL
ncbi:DNA-primase RepB domain-containing protein [Streptomyces cyaneofuscatus]